jgi:aminopeptidase-like protein
LSEGLQQRARDAAPSPATTGERLHGFVRELFPLCRSITGDGLRETLKEIGRRIPLVLHEVPTGTPALDWQVPLEWNVRAARIETLDGTAVVDFADCNLHVVSYSTPVDAIVSRDELSSHVHTLPDQPDLVPYRTAYYAEQWGFCLAHRVWETMRDARYRGRIDSTLAAGSLTYGELHIPGKEKDEVLISVHCCHPSLANDNLSSIAVATEIACHLLGRDNRLSYRLLFIPATIGSLTWLARNEVVLPNIGHGLVLSCVGDGGSFHYKQSRRGNAAIDRVVAHVLGRRHVPHKIMGFSPYGYDERQYCSPGYDLPVGCFMRSPNGTFPEYHTSADNLGLVTAEALEHSLEVLIDVIGVLERNVVFDRIDGRGEPQLGRRGLYRAISGQKDQAAAQMALLWLLNQADGRHSLLDIAERSGVPFEQLALAAEAASKADLIRPVANP